MPLFDAAFVINLDERTDRLRSFEDNTKHLSFNIERFTAIPAIVGQNINGMGERCSACILSHCAIIRKAIKQRLKSVFILEDDAIPCDDLNDRLRYIEAHIPTDWEHIYLGGYDIDVNKLEPIRNSTFLYNSVRTGGAHAYILRRRAYRKVLYELLLGYSTLDGMFADLIEGMYPWDKKRRNLPFYQSIIDILRPVPKLKSYTFLPVCFATDKESRSSIEPEGINTRDSHQLFKRKCENLNIKTNGHSELQPRFFIK